MFVQESKTIDLLDSYAVPSYCSWSLPSTIAPTPPTENDEQLEIYGDLVIGEFGFSLTYTPLMVALLRSYACAVNVPVVEITVCDLSTSTVVALIKLTILVPAVIPFPVRVVPTKSGVISPVELVSVVPLITTGATRT